MKELNRKQLMSIDGGSETLKRFGAWLHEVWCDIKETEVPETYCGRGNNVRC